MNIQIESLTHKHYSKILLAAIILFFLAARLYRISDNPPSLYWDEASIGYNAYSIIQTGRDEWGKFLPLHFRAFGEFKLPIFIYSVALFEKILGLNEWAVRLPAVLYSLGTVILVYLLARKVSGDDKISLLSSLFLSFCPWFFIFSRSGYEVSAGLMFFTLGLFLYFRSLDDYRFFLLSIFSFILSVYSYNSFRVLVPVTLIILVGYFCKQHLKNVQRVLPVLLLSLIIFVISMFPVIRLLRSDNGMGRLQTVGIFASSPGAFAILTNFTKNYLSHFSPEFLFSEGDKNLRSHQGGIGQLNWLNLPLLIAGIISILRSRKFICISILILTLISPIPAAITKESPHALRAITMAPLLSIVSAFGLVFIANLTRVRYLQALVVLSFFLSFTFYLYNFIYFYPALSSSDWQYGYKRIFLDYQNQFGKYDQVVVSDAYAQPYIFALFYLKYDPVGFRSQVHYNALGKWGFSTVEGFGNFLFKSVSPANIPKGRSLVFAAAKERLFNIKEKAVVKNLDNSTAFYVYEYQK